MGEDVWICDDVKYNCVTETYMYVLHVDVHRSACFMHSCIEH